MSTFVETLKRLYTGNKIQKNKLDTLLKENKINKQEYDYILEIKSIKSLEK